MYYLKKFSRHFLYNSIILCDYYYFFIVNNFSMFNIVSIIIFGLIVFFMNTSLPFFVFLLYIFQCAFKHLHTYYMVFVWWAQMESNHRPHAYQACALTIWAMSPYIRVISSCNSFVSLHSIFNVLLRVHWKINNNFE